MGLSAGIIGLPNVGKSTLFNAITKSQVEAANYPFATINPNVGIVNVPDNRLDELVKLIDPNKISNATFQFTDIAGLVKGASKGEGLGNQFLTNIREVDAICHVVRCFVDSNIVHVEGTVDPIRDIEIINLELILSDLEIVQKRIQKISKKAQSGDSETALELKICKKLIELFDDGKPARSFHFLDKEFEIVKNYNLITFKKVIYVANIDEESIATPEKNQNFLKVKQYALTENSKVIAISAKIEAEISLLSDDDQKTFMNDLGIKQSGIATLSKAAYDLLDLKTFFTYGKVEVRAWTFKKGMTAPNCAGLIHSDFEKGFIKCEVIKYEDMIHFKSEHLVKENGKLRLEGKEYIMQDGDICHFKFNVTK